MSFRSLDAVAGTGRRARTVASIAVGSTLLFAASVAGAQEEVGSEAIGAWHGSFQLDRDDPRIRTRGGADLMRIEVIHSRGQPVATISWVAGRAICEDPAAEPCEWIGSGGTVQGRILQQDLVFALPLSAQADDPAIVILRRSAGEPGSKQRAVGQLMNSKADYSYDFSYSAIRAARGLPPSQ